MQRHLRIRLAGLLLAAISAVSAYAQSIPGEDDAWVTGSGTQVDLNNFGNVNIAQMFGSLPQNSVVSFNGSSLNSALGQADTLVSRGATTISSNGFTAPLSIKGLSLVSNGNFTLTDGRAYRVTVGLARQSDTGTMTFTTTSAEGGTFSSSFTVTPILTFTNVSNSSDVHTIDCSGSAACSFPMTGNGNWVQTSSTGFDPQSMGIPIVPSGVQVGGYSTTGKKRFGGIQVGCGGTKSTGYGCGQNNELHGAGSIGQQIHGTKPPNDCAQPAPSPTPTPTGGGGCAAHGSAVTCLNNLAVTTTGGGGGSPSPSPTPVPSPSPVPLCSN